MKIPKIKLTFYNKLSNNSKRIIRNSYTLIASQLLKYVINLFISVWIVRYLGTELFGAFSYISALTGIFGIISSLGLQNIIVRELIKRPDESELLLGTSIFLSFISGIIAFVAFVCVVMVLNMDDKLLFYLALINGFTFIFDTLKILSYHYESKVQSEKVAKINNISIIVISLLKVICICLNLGIFVLSSLFILESLISGILLLLLFSKEVYSPINFTVDKRLAKSLLKDAFPLIISGFMIGIYMKIDQVMIQNLLGNEQAGIFAVAVRLTEIFYFIPVILLSSLFPSIIGSQHDVMLFRKKMDNLYGILISFSYAVIFFMTLFSRYILTNLYGSDFIEARLPLMILIWALLFVCIGVARNAYILSHNLTKYYMYATTIGAILNIACNSIFIPLYGIVGASMSTILSYSVSAYFSSLLFKPLRNEFYSVSKLILFPKFNIKSL